MNNIPAKKSLGQHWLVNEGVLDRIVAAAKIMPGETVLEIGPGTGTLTKRLVATGARIIAIEKDHRLIESLHEQFPSVKLIEGDVMTTNISCDKIVANIPYYLTSHLIRKIVEDWPARQRSGKRLSVAILLVQYEVAQRLMAKPPDMNLLALSVQLYAKPTLIMRVSRGSFRPMPDVDSAVIKLEPILGEHDFNERVMAIAKKAFGQKRKQLKFGPNPTARPQELSVDNWRQLAISS